MFQVLFLFATLAYGIRTRLHAALQVTPDATCQQWLNSSAGIQFLDCEQGNPGVPVPYNGTTGQCQLDMTDFSSYCNDTQQCYSTLTKAYNYFLSSGTCLPVYEDKYKPCSNSTDCANMYDNDGVARMCYQGFCYASCSSSSQCNSCLNETCQEMGSSNGTMSNMGCWNPYTVHQNGSAVANRTFQNTFRGMLYSLEASCSQNTQGVYCGMLEWTDMTNMTCDALNAQWGCCASTIMGSMEWCQWTNFTMFNNMSSLFNCNFTQAPCGGLPSAQSFCAFNVTSNSSSSSSSSSSSMSGSSSYSGGSSWLISSVSGSTGVGTTGVKGSGASGQAAVSWTMTLALVLAAAHMAY